MNKCRYNLSEDCHNKDCLNCVLDKIRAEFIFLYPKNFVGEPELGGLSCVFSLDKVLSVIDKYNTEGEE